MFVRGGIHSRRSDERSPLPARPRTSSQVSGSVLSKERAALRLQAFWRGQKERSKVGRLRIRRKPLGYFTHTLGLTFMHEAARERPISLKQRLYRIAEDQSSSALAKAWFATVIATTGLSIIGFIVETVPEIGYEYAELIHALEVFCTTVFTAEFFLRLAVCDQGSLSKCAFVRQPFNILDAIATLPFYVELLLRALGVSNASALRVFRLVRLIRVIRVFKLGRYASGVRLTAKALAASSQAISVLLFLLVMGVLLFASALFHIERLSCPNRQDMSLTELEAYAAECAIPFNRGVSPRFGLCCTDDGAAADFPSIPAASWWALVTMTSVGYGEVYPKTTQGKCIGFVVMLTGMVVIALPVAIVGQKFQDVYETNAMDSAKDAAAARMHVADEEWTIVPSSDVTAKLRALKIKDSGTAAAVAKLTMSLSDVWQQREQAMREDRKSVV